MSKIVLSFDDGRMDNFRVAKEVLMPLAVPATFNITTAYVDRSIPEELSPCVNESLSVGQVQQLYEAGFDIAGHGDCHQNTVEDIVAGIQKLRAWLELPDESTVGFASPESKLAEEEILARRQVLNRETNVGCVRIGLREPKNVLDRICRKMSEITGGKHWYVAGFRRSLEQLSGRYVLYSIPVMHKATLPQVKAIVEEAVRRKKDCVLMFHSILKQGEANYENAWSWDYDKFKGLCEYLVTLRDSGEIRIVTTMESLLDK